MSTYIPYFVDVITYRSYIHSGGIYRHMDWIYVLPYKVTSENHWQMASRVTKNSLLTVTKVLFNFLHAILCPEYIIPLKTTRTTRTPVFWEYPPLPMITYTMNSYQTPCHNKTKSKLHISKICQKLIRCANMKWIHLVLWKVQSGHDFVHRQTDWHLREKHNCIVMRIDEDSSAYSESFKRMECTNWDTDGRTDGRTTWNQYTPLSTSLKRGV